MSANAETFGGTMSDVRYRGGCLCGAIRLETAAEPYRVGNCHCLDCRKHHGAVFATFAIFPAEAVTITGTPADYRGRYFCPACGSSVFGRSGDEIEIPAGTLDEPSQVRPTYELWVRRREDWLPPFEVSHRYDGDRTSTGRSEP
jgi:hypothetical protein